MKRLKEYAFLFLNFFKRKSQYIYNDNELVEWIKSVIKYDNDKFVKMNDIEEIYNDHYYITDFTFLGYRVDLT